MWLRRHEPDCYRNIHKILLVHDFLVYRLTGTFAAVPSLLSSSLLLDVKAAKWWGPMLAYLGLSPEQLPDIYAHGQPIATVSREVARQTGLSTKTLVVSGALDQICGMTGVGNIAPGMLSESTGTVLAIHTLADGFFPRSEHGIHNFRHFQDGRYALIGVCPTACSALDWLLANFTGEDQTAATGTQAGCLYTVFWPRRARVPAWLRIGVIMLPHLAGGGGPQPNPRAAGRILRSRLRDAPKVISSVPCWKRLPLPCGECRGISTQRAEEFASCDRSGAGPATASGIR